MENQFTSDKFDQFGNYIGDDDSNSEDENENEHDPEINEPEEAVNTKSLLPEDKEYYPESAEIYPSYTKIKHEDEDREEYTNPIIEPKIARHVANDLRKRPVTLYSDNLMLSLFENPNSIRNVCFVGAFGHGKTELIDNLVSETHPGIIEDVIIRRDVTNQILGEGRRFDQLRWTDRLFLEKRRNMSISTEVMSLVHETTNETLVALNIIDTPGHPDFLDQVQVGLAMADGIVFCMDVVEGLTKIGTRLLVQCINTHLPIVLCLTKLDRLILELKLPPCDAYLKMRQIIEDFNTVLRQNLYRNRVSPECFNTAFTSAHYTLCFTLDSIGLMYGSSDKDFQMELGRNKMQIRQRPRAKDIACRLWGDYKLNMQTGQIKYTKETANHLKDSFIAYVLEPLYKVFTQVLSYEPPVWSKNLNITLKSSEMKLNTTPLLRIALSRIFGPFSSFVQIISDHLPPPIDRTTDPIQGNPPNVVALASKFVSSSDGEKIYALVRVFRGAIKRGMKINALSKVFEEDRSIDPEITIGDISLTHVRYTTPIEQATPGMIIKIESTDKDLIGISTLTDIYEFTLPPLVELLPVPLMKIAIEPLIPEKSPDMRKSIAKAQLCYPSLGVKIQGSEYTLVGTGEMFLDCVMHDIRNAFETIEIKVSDPFVVFSETIKNMSQMVCHAKINEECSIGVICEKLNNQTIQELELSHLARSTDLPKSLAKLGWDDINQNTVWCFGPDSKTGPNIFCVEQYPSYDDDKDEKSTQFSPMVRKILERSFVWATGEGPLCDAMMRGVIVKIVDVNWKSKTMVSPGLIIPALRNAIFASFLCAEPHLMEPIYTFEIITPHNGEYFVEQVVTKRRGKVIAKYPLKGTTLRINIAEVPLIDSFGLEVDLRAKTQGQSFALSYFSKWEIVPGDPLDSTIILRPLEPSVDEALAREFVVKTRRRKGQSEEVDISRYMNENELIELAQLQDF